MTKKVPKKIKPVEVEIVNEITLSAETINEIKSFMIIQRRILVKELTEKLRDLITAHK